MTNNIDFSNRLKKVMNYYQLSAAALADRIHVQRSSISHLLSGRNRPSLDFVLKMLEEFDTIDLYWLLNGTGTFPKKDIKMSGIITENAETTTLVNNLTSSDIEYITIFYKDGTFKQYRPNKKKKS